MFEMTRMNLAFVRKGQQVQRSNRGVNLVKSGETQKFRRPDAGLRPRTGVVGVEEPRPARFEASLT
jgi:hypothetical protein